MPLLLKPPGQISILNDLKLVALQLTRNQAPKKLCRRTSMIPGSDQSEFLANAISAVSQSHDSRIMVDMCKTPLRIARLGRYFAVLSLMGRPWHPSQTCFETFLIG